MGIDTVLVLQYFADGQEEGALRVSPGTRSDDGSNEVIMHR